MTHGQGNPAKDYEPSITVEGLPESGDGQYNVVLSGFKGEYGNIQVSNQTPVGLGGVVVTPEMLDENGGYTVTNFNTVGPGHYTVSAWQVVKGNKNQVVAQYEFDI